MMNLLEFNKTQKHLVQSYVKHIAIRIPTIFDFGFGRHRIAGRLADRASARAKTRKAGALPLKKPGTYFLLGDGAFGGLALHGLLVLGGRQDLFEEIQAVNLHASDIFLPESLGALTRLFKTKNFQRNGSEDKSELNSNA